MSAPSDRVTKSGPPPVLIWIAVFLALAGVATIVLYRRHEQQVERDIAHMQKLKEQVHYEAKLFPAKVTFQRGPTYQIEHVGPKPFRGLTGEFATCSDDSEGAELAEFYLMGEQTFQPEQMLADGSHPTIRSQLQSLFEVADPAELFQTVVPLKQEEFDGWMLRVRLIPSPHGGLINPERLPPAAVVALNARQAGDAPKKGEVDSRLSTGSPGIGNTRVDQRAKAERRLEEKHRSDLRTYDDRHHHYYLVEAVRDYGQGKAVVLRRYGKIYGPQTVDRAEGIIRKMAGSVTIPQ